jgi:hypothetical protein
MRLFPPSPATQTSRALSAHPIVTYVHLQYQNAERRTIIQQCVYSSQDHLKIETHDLDHSILASAENDII